MSSADEPQPSNADEDKNESNPLGAGFDFTDPSSPLARYYLQLSDVIGVSILTCIAFYFSFLPIWHTDLWAHAAFGKWIFEHRQLPEHEPFTATADPSVSVPSTQWLSQIMYGALLRLGGSAGGDPQRSLERGVELLRSLHWLATTGSFLFLWLAYRRASHSASWANVALLLVFLGIGAASAVQRPQAFGTLCFAGLLFVLSANNLQRWAMAGLPILFVLWANLHGSFIVGLAFFFLATLGRLANDCRQSDGTTWRDILRGTTIRRLAIAFLLSCAAVTLLNPLGPRLIAEVLTFADRPNIHKLDEWRPLSFHSGPGGHWTFLASWVIVLLIWAGSRFAKPFQLLSVVPFGLWPLFQERSMVWWLQLAPWLIATLGPEVGKRRSLLRQVPTSVPSLRKTFLAMGLALLATLWAPPIQWLLKGFPASLEQSLSKGTAWRLGLELQAPPANRGRWLGTFRESLRFYPGERFQGAIFSSETQGEYLLRVAPEQSILIYTHAHFFPEGFWQECMDVKNARGDWRDWLARYDVNMIVVEPDLYPNLAQALRQDPAWQVVMDEAAAKRSRAGDSLFVAIRKHPL